MTDFFRFPHTPHLLWLGTGAPRDDKVLSPDEAQALLDGEVTVEEKLDGANLGMSLAPDGRLRAQNRGQYLSEPLGGQFARLPAWMGQHEEALRAVLTPTLILFGEWCAARCSRSGRPRGRRRRRPATSQAGRRSPANAGRRNALAQSAGLVTVPRVAQGRHTPQSLTELVTRTPSRYREGPLEGVVIRRESADWCEARAKLVRPDFTQAIETHWRSRAIEWNRVDYAARSRE
jgi:hypothetical protein